VLFYLALFILDFVDLSSDCQALSASPNSAPSAESVIFTPLLVMILVSYNSQNESRDISVYPEFTKTRSPLPAVFLPRSTSLLLENV